MDLFGINVPFGCNLKCQEKATKDKPECGKGHMGKCMKGTNKCYICGMDGHNRIRCQVFIDFANSRKGSSEALNPDP